MKIQNLFLTLRLITMNNETCRFNIHAQKYHLYNAILNQIELYYLRIKAQRHLGVLMLKDIFELFLEQEQLSNVGEHTRITLFGEYAAFIRSRYGDDMPVNEYCEKNNFQTILSDFRVFGVLHRYMHPALPKHDTSIKRDNSINELKSTINKLTGELVEKVCQLENELEKTEVNICESNKWFDQLPDLQSFDEHEVNYIIKMLEKHKKFLIRREELKDQLK